MRTNIEIDDALIGQAMSLSGLPTKKETVEAALRLLVQFKKKEALCQVRGKLKWDGNLDELRTDRDFGR
jgi:Arc/MetJ family transcription regulator